MKAAYRAKARSSNKENSTSEIPAASPSFPVMGAAMKAATTIRTRVMLMTVVARNLKALAALTEVASGLYPWFGKRGKGTRELRYQKEREAKNE